MPINSTHPEYDENAPIWEKCETFYKGEEAVKKKGIKYLPQISEQTPLDYEAYKNRAIFYNSVGRTIAGLVGSIFRKEPAVTLPSRLEYLKKDATGTGMSLTELAIRLVTEIMTTARTGLLADRPVDGGKAYLAVYDADDIINWNTDANSTFVVLEEDYYDSSEDKYKLEEKEQFRELTFDDSGNYIVNIWREGSKKDSSWILYDTITPTKGGKSFNYIPFTCISPSGLDFEVDRPPIADLVNVQHKHYMLSADYANALHVTSCPTPAVYADIKAEDFVFRLGSYGGLVLPAGSKAEFVEYKGEGLKSIEDALTKLEGMLAALGARLVEVKKSSFVETAEGVRTREAAATAILSSIVASVEAGLEKAIKWIAEWEGADPNEVRVSLNKELVQTTLDANMLNSLVQALQSGAISPETLYHNLEEAGMYDPSMTFEKEQQNIKSSAVQTENQQTIVKTLDNQTNV